MNKAVSALYYYAIEVVSAMQYSSVLPTGSHANARFLIT
jgi:hypothetical protein